MCDRKMAHGASIVSDAHHRVWLDVCQNVAQLLQTDQLGFSVCSRNRHQFRATIANAIIAIAIVAIIA